ncbi:MAG: tetratricopeptide repeat protein [Algibacter sp.]
MKHILIIVLLLFVSVSFAQDKEALEAVRTSNNHIYEANNLASNDDFVSAEVEYRKALSKQPSAVTGAYNLGNSYYEKGNYEEALYRHQEAAKGATTKEERHKAFHNMGNVLMKNQNFKEAVEAYKSALRNNPTDEETRYNLALAKKKQKEQEDKQDENKDDENKEDKDNSEDKKDENKENKDEDSKDNKDEDSKDDKNKEDEEKEDKKDKGDDEKKEEDKKDDEGKPKDEKEDKGKSDEDKKKDEKQPQPQPGQLSPQQIKSLLEAMNNQEQKVQEKMNAEKQKGVKIKTEKDW